MSKVTPKRRSAAEAEALLQSCTRHLCWRKRDTPAEILRALADEADKTDNEEAADTYGQGAIVEDTERMVAQSLGKEGALLFVTGVMAQLCALRIWCERAGHNVVGYHPHAHFEEREEGALSTLHNIERVHLGKRHRIISAQDIEDAPRLAAIVLELPQRDLGGELPHWDELGAQCAAIQMSGAKAHLDGARLFEAQAYYERSLADICAPFDSVYVSAYKGLASFAGAFLAGDADFILEAKAWRRRHGGECFQLFPFALGARAAWRTRVDHFGAWRQHAIAIGLALQDLEGIRITPDPPPTNLMHVFLDVSAAAAQEAAFEIAEQQSVCLFRRVRPIEFPRTCAFELSVHEGAMEFEPSEVAQLLRALLLRAKEIEEEWQSLE